MKFRFVIILTIALALTACTLSLAEDTTPPPDYVSPTPPVDIGPLYPEQPPSPAQAEEFYIASCAPCHGTDGLGNGPMAASMPVAVPAIGLRDISSQAVPAEWYTAITNGNLERGMPPFIGHPAQERWNVLAYVYMLSATADELQLGADLYAANCADCHGLDGSANIEADFTNQEIMSQTSGTSLYRGIAEGKGPMQPFANAFSEDEIWAIVAHLRSLTFDLGDLPTPTPTSEPAFTPTQDSTITSGSLITTEDLTPSTTPETSLLTITGVVSNGTDSSLVTGAMITLNQYDMNTGQQAEIQATETDAAGRYEFSNIPADPSYGYWASIEFQGVPYPSEFITYDGTITAFDLPIITYDVTTDLTTLAIDQVHIYFDFSQSGSISIIEVYVFSNPGEQTYLVAMDTDEIPFISTPTGATLVQYQQAQTAAQLMGTTDGFAILPSGSEQYGIVANFSMPYEKKIELVQSFQLPVTSLTVLGQTGVRIKSNQLTDSGIQNIDNRDFQTYEAINLPAGSSIPMTISGTPGEPGSTGLDQRSWLLIGIGILGVVFIGLGIFLFLRDRALTKMAEFEEDSAEAAEEPDALGSDPEALTDAIIALDEQLKNGEITKEAHGKRRTELKTRLKQLL